MIKLSGYYIAPEEIVAIEAVASNRPDYPYRLAVTLKSGRAYSVDYRDEQRRNEVADSIVRAVDFARDREAPPTMQTIRWAVQAEVDKLRPYLRRIEKAMKAAGAEPDN